MVIFLDIDGVLCIGKSYVEWDNVCGAYIRKALNETNAKLVMTSSWRVVDNKLMYQRLEEFNMTKFLHDDPETKNIVRKMSMRFGFRGEEIQEWLDRHPEVDNYIIIDDVEDFYFTQLKYLVKTNSNTGFGEREYKLVLEKFNDNLTRVA